MMSSYVLAVFFAFSTSTFAGSLPNEKAYADDGKLMIDICNKFAEEPNAMKLHKAALATQNVRVISCSDYNGECSLYGTFLTLAILVSKDGEITVAEREKMREHLTRLKIAVSGGKRKLHEEVIKLNPPADR